MSEPVVGTASDLHAIWGSCLHRIDQKLDVPERNVLRDTTPLALEGPHLKIGVPAIWSRDWLCRPHILNQLASTLHDLTGREIQPVFVVAEGPRGTMEPPVPSPSPPPPTPSPIPAAPAARPAAEEMRCALRPDYTFENFVRGNANNLAAAAAQAVGDAPGKAFNPLFIYGGVGLGKTHLMHAIGNVVLSRNRKKRVVYISAEAFTNELIEGIQERQVRRFRDTYRKVDVLLIDDIQFLINKEQTQEEFFHTFNELHNTHKQIVITSDRPPKQIATLQDRLRSRFEWGMIADVQTPNLETRVAILRKKAEMFGVPVPDDVTSFIAEKIHSNIRELEGALTRVVTLCSLTSRPVNLEAAAEALQDAIRSSNQKALDVPAIKSVVCEYFNISHEELVGRRKDQRVVRPRQIAMYLCKELTESSYPVIAAQFGGKDHTTVIHAHRKVEENRADPYFKTSLENLRERLKEFAR